MYNVLLKKKNQKLKIFSEIDNYWSIKKNHANYMIHHIIVRDGPIN
jgi:hypothetical protein